MTSKTNVSWLLGLLVGLGCGEESGAIYDGDGQTDEDESPAKAGDDCAPLNVTQVCNCDDLKGAQNCTSSGWSECTCLDEEGGGTVTGPGKTPQAGVSTPAGNLRSDIKFDWERTEPVEGSCEPGYYEGDFMGLYASQLTFINFPIPVFALGQPGRPGLSFTLEKRGDGETLEITNGKMDGTADFLFPFTGSLTGTLDCNTLQFNAILDGFYSLGLEGIGMFKFKGPLTGGYDKLNRRITAGTWNVTEYDPPPTLPNAGGTGNWHAEWQAP